MTESAEQIASPLNACCYKEQCIAAQQERDEALALAAAVREALKEVTGVLRFAFGDQNGAGALTEGQILGLCVDPFGMLHDAEQVVALPLPTALTDLEARIRADEREKCAVVAENTAADHDEDTPGGFCAANAARHAAAAIRQRAQEG